MKTHPSHYAKHPDTYHEAVICLSREDMEDLLGGRDEYACPDDACGDDVEPVGEQLQVLVASIVWRHRHWSSSAHLRRAHAEGPLLPATIDLATHDRDRLFVHRRRVPGLDRREIRLARL